MKLILIMGIVFSSAHALAFQCKNLSFNQAKKAVVELNKYNDLKSIFVIDKYCEACQDPYPSPILVGTVSLKRIQDSYQVAVNDSPLDISHIYVEGRSLSHLTGCKTVAVSKFLD